MKKFVKWTAIILGVLIVCALLGFLYFIPPFTLAPPEAFIQPEADAAPATMNIADPAKHAITERGRYLVMTLGCAGCHTPGGDKGPKFDTHYLAGGLKFADPNYGTSVSRNLTPDFESGLGRRTDAQLARTLRTGVFGENGRVFFPFFMPWADFSHLSMEDHYAIVSFLRMLKPVKHTIPDFNPHSELDNYGFFGLDYGSQ